MAVNFYLGSIDINQNVNLFDSLPDYNDVFPPAYYNIDLNADMRVLLGMYGNYVQNGQDANQVNINLSFSGNSEYLKKLLGYPSVYESNGSVTLNWTPVATTGQQPSVDRKGVTTGMEAGNYNLGFRLLEVAAVQIFNHARARAAIRNDTEFTAAMKQGVNDIQSKIVAYGANKVVDGVKDDIFNQYVQQNLLALSTDDVTAVVNFNFDNFNFGGYKTGVIINFNMPGIFDSSNIPVSSNLYGIAADPKVNILLKFSHVNNWQTAA
jgi:hypothetical protein